MFDSFSGAPPTREVADADASLHTHPDPRSDEYPDDHAAYTAAYTAAYARTEAAIEAALAQATEAAEAATEAATAAERSAEGPYDAFFAWAIPEARALQQRYHLQGWSITLQVVPDDALALAHAAEVDVREAYRAATIYLARSLVLEAERETLRHVIDHELQHVVLHPLDALKSFILDITPEGLRGLVIGEFARANERIRATFERLLHESRDHAAGC